MTTSYFASLSLAAALMAITLSGCDDVHDSQASPAADGTTVLCNLNVSYDSGIRSRAGDIVPGDGSDIVELSYVIRDVQGNTLYGTGLQDSPEPVKGAGGWNLSLPLTKGTDYSVLLWAESDKADVRVNTLPSGSPGDEYKSTIVSLQDSLYVYRGSYHGDCDAMALYRTFRVEAAAETFELKRPLCQVIVATDDEEILAKTKKMQVGIVTKRNTSWSSINNYSSNPGVVYEYPNGGIEYKSFEAQWNNERYVSECSAYKLSDPSLTLLYIDYHSCSPWASYLGGGDLIDYKTLRIWYGTENEHSYRDDQGEFVEIPLEASLGESGCLLQPNTQIVIVLRKKPDGTTTFDIQGDTGFDKKPGVDIGNAPEPPEDPLGYRGYSHDFDFTWGGAEGFDVFTYYQEGVAKTYPYYLDNVSANPYHIDTFDRLSFGDADISKVRDIPNMNDYGTLEGMFSHTWQLTEFSVTNYWAGCGSMKSMFSESALPSIDLSTWYCQAIVNTSYMFWSCSIERADIPTFRDVTDMSHMFEDCSRLTYIDFGEFVPSQVAGAQDMFKGCYSLTHIRCTQAFYEWVSNNLTYLNMPSQMTESGATWEIID